MVVSDLLKTGDRGMIKVMVTEKLCLEKFDVNPILGRFTLRDENSTIGYGTIKKYKPSKGKK